MLNNDPDFSTVIDVYVDLDRHVQAMQDSGTVMDDPQLFFALVDAQKVAVQNMIEPSVEMVAALR